MFDALDLVNYRRSRLGEFCERHFLGEDTETLLNGLLEGEPSPSTVSAAELWEIAQIARRRPPLRSLVEGLAPIHAYASVDGGDGFVAALRGWLELYGRRNGHFGELAEPTFAEEPRVVLALLRSYLGSPEPRSLQAGVIAHRDELAARLDAQLAESERAEFRDLVTRARRYVPVKEDRNLITSVSRASLRKPALAAGRKLVAAGLIDQAAEVFYLTVPEIKAAGQGSVAGLRAPIAERRTEHDYWRNVVPPPSIGGGLEEEAHGKVTTLHGVGACAGVVRAVARIVMTLDEADRLNAGEVLVTRTTTSTWTPLFPTAAAIIVDGGSMLSHAAVVAREFQIPCVVGVMTATRDIPDGATVTVDGTTGLVIIEPD